MKWIVYQDVPAEADGSTLESDDGGQAAIVYAGGGVYAPFEIRLHSWKDGPVPSGPEWLSEAHPAIAQMAGKTLKITVEIV